MRIGGLHKFSLIDYPGKMAAVVFTQGCNFRCGYCHNAQLVTPERYSDALEESAILEFLESRKGKLEGIVITGGEPTIQQGLLEFLAKLKAMRFAVKLDTNGSHPDILASVLSANLIDFIAMDIKTSPMNYEKAVGTRIDLERIVASIDLISKSGLPHHFRTTLVRAHCSPKDVKEIRRLIGPVAKYVLQTFIPSAGIMDPVLLAEPQYSLPEIQELRLQFQTGA